MALTTQQLITQLYVGYYNRAPDPEGLNYWIGRVNAGVSLADIADSFAASPEAIATYPFLALPNVANAENFLTQVYQNLFNRAPDADGLAYYAGKLSSGQTTPGQIIAEIQANANTNTNNTDGQILGNKVAVGLSWVGQAANTPNFQFDAAAKSSAGSVLVGVDSTAASVTAANAKVETFFDTIVTGETQTLTVGVDNLVGTASNDLFKVIATNNATGADATTWNSSDTLDGGAGKDSLNVEVKGAFNATLYSTTNIETVNIDNSTAAAAAGHAGAGTAVDASKFAGVENVNQIGKASAVTNLAAGSTAGFKSIDSTAALSVTAADAAASVAVNLDGVKDTSDNVVSVNVGGKAVSSVSVSGAVTNAAIAGVKEVFTATFAAATDADTITFDGVATLAVTPGTNLEVAAEFVAHYNAQAGATWVAVDNTDGTVTFTSKVAGTRGDVVTGDFAIVDAGAPGGQTTVTVAAPTTQGVTAVPNQSLALSVAAGKDVETVSVNSASATTLTVTQDATSTKNITAIDAAASTGAITYASAGSVKTINTGSGADKVTISTATTATVSAMVSSGAGNDEITVSTTGTGTTTINAGAGDDKIIVTGTLNTRTSIDGGEGADTLSLAGKTLIAEDYVLFNNAIKNVESVEFTGATDAEVDASKLAFGAYTFAGNAGDKITEASAVAVTTKAALTASATGFKADGADADTAPDAWGGALNVTQTGSGTVTLNGDAVALAVKSGTSAVASVVNGEANKLAITLTNGANSATAPTADTLTTVSYTATGNVTSLTLSGNGTATIVGGDKLATIDASGLGGTLAYGANAGNITGGLTFTADGDIAEAITLGSGTDTVALGTQSTYAKYDTITGFDATKETNDGKSTTDVITFDGVTLNGSAANQATKITLTSSATTLDLAFVEAAAADTVGGAVSFFQFEGNTYLFQNTGAGALEATDLAAKIVGLVDFSTAWGVYTA